MILGLASPTYAGAMPAEGGLSWLLDGCGGELTHLISDAATMQIIRWTGGGNGLAAHNYDGDMLTDEVSQARRVRGRDRGSGSGSPGYPGYPAL